jgi:aldose 1-epimerase
VDETQLVLEAGDARLVVRLHDGGRLGSVTVGGRELLVGGDPRDPMSWGSYPMAPWAGRVNLGRFTFDGRTHQLPITMTPHAIHGVVYDRPWSVVGDDTIAIDLDHRWPFRGRVVQRFALDEDGLEVTMTVTADEPMPAVIGWHPWFRRVLADGAEPVGLAFSAATMLVRGADGIPTGERVPPTAGPWDDAFTDLAADPVLEWPGQLRLSIASTCRWWVVYSMPEHAICVEPQSGPPDGIGPSPDGLGHAPEGVGSAPDVVVPGRPLTHSMRWTWTRLG